MKQHKWHKEIKAWADGAEIEFKVNGEGDWKLLKGTPYWECDNDLFRIKPQPKEPQYFYVWRNHKGEVLFHDGDRIRVTPMEYKFIGKIKLEMEG